MDGRPQRSLPVRRAWPRPRDARSSWRCDEDGNFLALRGPHRSPTWAPTCRPSRPRCRPSCTARCWPGQYKTPQIYVEVKAVFTNTAPVDAYRGAGRPEATYLLERVVDTLCAGAGARPGRDAPAQLHHQQFPYQTPVGAGVRHRQLSGHARQGASSWPTCAGFEARRRQRGQGQAARHRASPPRSRPAASRRRNVAGALGARVGLFECGEVRVHPTGNVTVFTGTHSHGQGHETTFAQIVAEQAGHPGRRRSRSCTATPASVPFGMGTYGSRSLAVGGAAIVKALRQDHRQGQEDRGPPAGGGRGRHRVRRRRVHASPAPTRPMTFGEVAFAAYVPHNYPLDTLEPGLDETAFYDPTNFTYPGRHLHLRGRGRSRHRRGRRRSTSPRSTTSATSSTR